MHERAGLTSESLTEGSKEQPAFSIAEMLEPSNMYMNMVLASQSH
jgi:hypothetical protein